MKNLIIIFFALLSVSLRANGGDNEFVAFSLKGKVQYKAKAGDKTWTAVATKTPFYKGAVVKIGKGEELVLLHKNYKTIKLIKTGEYKIDNLIKEAEKQPADESTAYLQFIWKEFNKKHKDAESYHSEYMQTKGGVERSGCTRPLMLSPVYGEKKHSENVTLIWEQDSGTTTYTVVFFENENEDTKLLELDVNGTSLTLSAQTFWFRPGKTYYWVAYPKGKPNCARYTFSIVKKEEAEKVVADVASTFEKSAKTPLDAVKAATILEEAGYMDEAGAYFLQAMTLSNYAEEYKIIYSSWLARAGNFEEARKWWVA
ncbi:MAG: tetratricopeptide repeat protein [Bacteroidota bacterium]